MLQDINNCDCLTKLKLIGKVVPYEPIIFDDTLSYYADEVEEGTLCIANNRCEDNGYYDQDGNYISNIEITKDLYPINYCPVCGKKIEYRKVEYPQLKRTVE